MVIHATHVHALHRPIHHRHRSVLSIRPVMTAGDDQRRLRNARSLAEGPPARKTSNRQLRNSMTTYFSQSIFIWRDRENPDRRTQRLSSVEDSIGALFRADVSDYSSDNTGRLRPLWRAALHNLSRAKEDKLPGSSLSAHDAMRQLVHAVGILAPQGDRL